MLSGIVLSTFITLGGWSTHLVDCGKRSGLDCEYNETHNMIMVEHKGLTVGTFKNSYHKNSQVAGYTFRKGNYSALVGMATGYSGDNECLVSIGKLCNIVALSYSLEPIKITLLGEALAISFEFKI